MDNSRGQAAPQRGGVTLTKVHGTKTSVSIISTAAISTRSKTQLDDRVIENRKPFLEQHRERLQNIRKDLQKGLETPLADSGMQKILNDTNVTITLSKLLQISPKLH